MKLPSLFIWEKQVSNKSNISSILPASGIIVYLFCTVATHCDWLSYQRDQLKISQSTNTWIKEFLSQSDWEIKKYFFSATNSRWNATHIHLCVWCSLSLPPWCPLMKPLTAPPAPLDETIDTRGSGPTCSLFPCWRPSMKPLSVHR